jgi:hypothetical protein
MRNSSRPRPCSTRWRWILPNSTTFTPLPTLRVSAYSAIRSKWRAAQTLTLHHRRRGSTRVLKRGRGPCARGLRDGRIAPQLGELRRVGCAAGGTARLAPSSVNGPPDLGRAARCLRGIARGRSPGNDRRGGLPAGQARRSRPRLVQRRCEWCSDLRREAAPRDMNRKTPQRATRAQSPEGNTVSLIAINAASGRSPYPVVARSARGTREQT